MTGYGCVACAISVMLAMDVCHVPYIARLLKDVFRVPYSVRLAMDVSCDI